MKKDILVSCIITTYNRNKLLPRAIKSVINQTYKNLEIIIVNDGSRDNTRETIKEFAGVDSRIKIINNKINQGVSRARNSGIHLATGKYIAFLDDDDEWLKEKIKIQYKLMDKFSLVCCQPIFRMIKASGEERIVEKRKKKMKKHISFEDAFRNFSQIFVSGSMFKTREIRAVNGFDGNLTRGEFWDFVLKILQFFGNAYIQDEVLVIFDRTPREDRVSQTDKLDDVFQVYDRYKNKVSLGSRMYRKNILINNEYKEKRGIIRYYYKLVSFCYFIFYKFIFMFKRNVS